MATKLSAMRHQPRRYAVKITGKGVTKLPLDKRNMRHHRALGD